MLMRVLFTIVSFEQMFWLLDGFELGAPCENNEDCIVENSRCQDGKCSCLPYYASYNSTLCLQSSLLGFECHVSEQCSKKVANSTCISGTCQCDRGYLQFRRHTCLTPAKLGDICYSDGHCKLWNTDTRCEFLIQNLFGKCVCTSPLKASKSGTCAPETETNTTVIKTETMSTAESNPSVILLGTDQQTSSTVSLMKAPYRPNSSFHNYTPSKYSQKITHEVSPNTNKKPPFQTQKPKPTSFSTLSTNLSAVSTSRPSHDFPKKGGRPQTTSQTSNKNHFQEKISTELTPPSPKPTSPAKPSKATITLIEKPKPIFRPNKPNKYSVFNLPNLVKFQTPPPTSNSFTSSYPKLTVLQSVPTTIGLPEKLTTWIINNSDPKPTVPTKFQAPTAAPPTKNTQNKFHGKKPSSPISSTPFSAFINSNKIGGQYSTIKLNSVNLSNNQSNLSKFGQNKYTSNPEHVTLTTQATVSHYKRTTQNPFLKTGTNSSRQPPKTTALVFTRVTAKQEPSPKTTPQTNIFKQPSRVSGSGFPLELGNLNSLQGPLKQKDQNRHHLNFKPTQETPVSSWSRPVTPGSSNIITKIIASPGPAALYNPTIKAGQEKEPNKVSLGLPCKTHKQCARADSESRCINGVCDCIQPRNNTTGSYCNANNRGCHPNTFQCKSSGKCISWFFVCDGRRDCTDGSDEACTGRNGCPEFGFRCGKLEPAVCISQAARCDGAWDCPGGEDEINCTAPVHQDCPPHTYKCLSGQCVPEYEYCNAAVACKDGTDEIPHACAASWDTDVTTLGYCPFRCGNGRCRSSAVACSGKDGCGDNSDETKCNVCKCPKMS